MRLSALLNALQLLPIGRLDGANWMKSPPGGDNIKREDMTVSSASVAVKTAPGRHFMCVTNSD